MARRSLKEKIEYVRSAFVEIGVNLRPGSRLDQVTRVFFDGEGVPRRHVAPHDPGFRVAQEGLRDVYTLEPILGSLASIELEGDRDAVIKRLLKDSAIPLAEAPTSPGRDLQTELLTAATCVRAEMAEVALQEPPDVQTTLDGKRWGIAVKRLKSAKRLDDNMRDAAKQVERSGLPGVILLDISLAFNGESIPLFAPSAAEFEAAQENRLQEIIRMNERVILDRAQAKGVGLVYVFDSQIRQVPEDGWGLATCHVSVDAAQRDGIRDLCRPFIQAFSKGIDRLSEAHPRCRR